MKQAKDTYSYRGALVSDRFIIRALAVYGYNIVAQLMVLGIILAVIGISYLIVMLVI